jgi:transcriptional regulator
MNGRGMTLAEIAAVLGITRGGVFMAEQAALKKCRRICAARKIRLEDLFDRLAVDKPNCPVAREETK